MLNQKMLKAVAYRLCARKVSKAQGLKAMDKLCRTINLMKSACKFWKPDLNPVQLTWIHNSSDSTMLLTRPRYENISPFDFAIFLINPPLHKPLIDIADLICLRVNM